MHSAGSGEICDLLRWRSGSFLKDHLMEAHEAFDYWVMELNHSDLRQRSFIRVEGRVPGRGVGVGRPGSRWRVGPLLFMRPQ
jgi:hypothetical protein